MDSTDDHPVVEESFHWLEAPETFREQLDWHREEMQAMEAHRIVRQRLNYTLSPTFEAWLEWSGEWENVILKDLCEARARLKELDKKCFTAGLLDQNGESEDFHTQKQETFAVDVDAKSQESECVMFSNLRPEAGTQQFEALRPLWSFPTVCRSSSDSDLLLLTRLPDSPYSSPLRCSGYFSVGFDILGLLGLSSDHFR